MKFVKNTKRIKLCTSVYKIIDFDCSDCSLLVEDIEVDGREPEETS